jgi:hypothetical protein
LNHRLTPEVARELEDAIGYYDSCIEGLGDEFLDEFHTALRRIVAFPEAWTSLSTSTRRCLLNRFPFSLVYSIEDDCILVLALMHMQRMPKKW